MASDRWLYVIASAGRAPALLAHTIHARPQGVCLWFLSFGHCCTLEAIVELLNLVEKKLLKLEIEMEMKSKACLLKPPTATVDIEPG